MNLFFYFMVKKANEFVLPDNGYDNDMWSGHLTLPLSWQKEIPPFAIIF